MKMKITLNLLTLIVTLFIINSSLAQTSSHSSVAVSIGESWLPVNEFNPPEAKKQNGNTIEVAPPLKNVLEGVSFYTMKATCDSDNVIFLKLINTNDYIVTIEWQLNPNDNKTLINIPANTSYQGECSSDNDTVSKLIFKNNNESESFNEINYLFKTVKVLIAQ
ncbi:MAG: hypothetical protein K0B10_08715 [Vicingaceae bacterium]|nr:hypothetical protein [Vicingaceae bacterium]